MPSYDDDVPTPQEEDLFRKLVENTEYEQRLRHLVEVKQNIQLKLIFFLIKF